LAHLNPFAAMIERLARGSNFYNVDTHLKVPDKLLKAYSPFLIENAGDKIVERIYSGSLLRTYMIKEILRKHKAFPRFKSKMRYQLKKFLAENKPEIASTIDSTIKRMPLGSYILKHHELVAIWFEQMFHIDKTRVHILKPDSPSIEECDGTMSCTFTKSEIEFTGKCIKDNVKPDIPTQPVLGALSQFLSTGLRLFACLFEPFTGGKQGYDFMPVTYNFPDGEDKSTRVEFFFNSRIT